MLEETNAGSCVFPDVGQLTSQHVSRLMPKATQIAKHGTAVSLTPDGAGVPLDANTKETDTARIRLQEKTLAPLSKRRQPVCTILTLLLFLCV